VEDVDFGEDFVAGNSNKLQKLDLEEKLVEPSMCSHSSELHVLHYCRLSSHSCRDKF
jgi:hypothetical protein